MIQISHLEHELWCKTKEADGWCYGEWRYSKRRTHPDLVSCESLQDSERVKNLAFVRQLPLLLARIGFQIDRAERAQ
ncbi:RyR domain-containing protein [Ornatilinea apprima]|uniref:RyR domain-containing protein n=1 Tax=Ornatilinea apprima TaxID=1134406 RepID=UPI0009E7AE2E